MFPSVDDTLDDILNESGDEEEQDAIVNQVLDEIGIEISGKVRHFCCFFSLIKLKYEFILIIFFVTIQQFAFKNKICIN